MKVSFDLPVEKAKALSYVLKFNKVRDGDFLRYAVDKAIDEALDANCPGDLKAKIESDQEELEREEKGDILFLEGSDSRGWFDWVSGPTMDLRPIQVVTTTETKRGHFAQVFVADAN